ncbi:MAG: cystathionine beta-lyase [Gammaproteobacteria bacterium]|nr:cystathionine beta-lyase [Gammaproteobacteria bacterium]
MKKRHPDTALVHGGRNRDLSAGTVNIPPYRSSTVLFESLAAFHEFSPGDPLAFRYARQGTPTSRALESAYTELEGAAGTIATCSGLSGITVALSAFLRPGDQVIMTEGAYEPTVDYARSVLAELDVEVVMVPPNIGGEIAPLLTPRTRVVYLESPSSLTFELQDVPAVAAALRAHAPDEASRPVLMLDNTWATGLFHKPLALGVDVVLQAATKYIIGHSDAMLGLVACNERTLPAVRRMARLQGVCASPDDCWLGLRGIRTLGIRLRHHMQSALTLAQWLETQPAVAQVIHPALPSHPEHAIWRRDFTGASGLFSLRLQPQYDLEAVRRMLDGMALFGMGYSFGAFESLLIPVRLPPHRQPLPPGGMLLRLHAGLEDVADLQADLAAGLARLESN